MNITYRNSITSEEYNSIRSSVGFRQSHPEQVKAGLDGSAIIISAYDHDKVVGMARLIWDGGGVALLDDILVIPEYHLKGVENEMINRILDFLKDKLKPGFGIQVDVKVWSNQESMYEKLGFQESTPQRRGVSMHTCLTSQIELTDAMFKQGEFRTKE